MSETGSNADAMYKTLRALTHHQEGMRPISAHLLVETPLEIIVNGVSRVTIMCTPGRTRELVYGFVYSEGWIQDVSEIDACTILSGRRGDGEDLMEARLTISKAVLGMQGAPEKRISYSSCGICGTTRFSELKRGVGRVKARQRFSMDVLKSCPGKLSELQVLYEKTGGSHAAVIFDSAGTPVFYCEDMGRHNALDKGIGYCLLNGVPRDDKIIVSSGRASLEMILKAARAGFPVFVAMSRPTSRAVEAAKFFNITLVDMAKNTNRIYSHARRIEGF